jgi:hypothetical protein
MTSTMIDHDLDEQIVAAHAELGLLAPVQQQEKTSSFKFILSLVNFSFESTKPKPNTPSTSNAKASSDESDDPDLDLQIARAKAELDRIQLEGEHFRHRRERQRQKSQNNLKEKTRALETRMQQQRKAPDNLMRQIVAQTFNEPARNRFCLNMEIKNVHAISTMWWMNRQLGLQLNALDDLDELLDFERTNLQEEAHRNRAQLIMLTETAASPQVINLKSQQLDQEQYEQDELLLDQQQLEISIQLAHKGSPAPPTPTTKSKVKYNPPFSLLLVSPSPTVRAAITA